MVQAAAVFAVGAAATCFISTLKPSTCSNGQSKAPSHNFDFEPAESLQKRNVFSHCINAA
jgi:hypothetical protein